jgi:hypothetical protein
VNSKLNFIYFSEPVSAIHVMFAQNQFDVKRRSERFGFIDFILTVAD